MANVAGAILFGVLAFLLSILGTISNSSPLIVAIAFSNKDV
jgi:hypothetical protein